jgi:hypothetical protein
MSEAPTPSPGRQRGQEWRAYHALALLPAIGMLGGLPWANRVHPLVLGLPFLMAWLVGWVLATAAIMALILRLDTARGLASNEVQGEEAGTAP